MANYGMLFGGQQLQTPDIYGSYMKGKQDDQVSRLNDLKIAGQQLTNKDTQNQLDMSAFQRLSHTAKGLAAIQDDAARNRAYQAVLPHLQKLDPTHQWPQAISQQDAQEFATQMDLMDTGGMTEAQLKALQLQISKQNADANTKKADALTKKADALSKSTVGPDGKSVDAWAIRTLLQGDPNSPEYAAAYAEASKPKTQYQQTENGLVPITINTDMSSYRKPSGSVLSQPIGGKNGDVPPPVVGAPIPGTSRPTNNEQNVASGFYDRMVEANNIIDGLESKGYKPDVQDFLTSGGKWTNALTSDQGQQYRQAQENWVRANLRKESGAAIPEGEMESEIKNYFPMPGDKPDTIKQKAQFRKTVTEAMRKSAGPAAKQGPQQITGKQSASDIPYKNAQGWELHQDANGNKAYVGPNGEIEEVQ